MSSRQGERPGTIPGSRSIIIIPSRAPAVQENLQNSPCSGQHGGGLPILLERFVNRIWGAWQKSDAPALQAGLNGSVTRQPPPFIYCGELD